MALNNLEFGLLMMVAGMGLTLLTLWVLTLVMQLLNRLFKPERRTG
ncbi:MAG: OadG-related small transporter subunit [Clostridia bacterium]|mgnify:CR=1 FL=1|jgi:Na+-transporting methylmalonyl-CoA/oxaloacetate decarboxylase gamma subunit|nr:OadG-related small transporter subunit [Clostridia bacterium]MDH7572871.1 OadG-related small transporter subunit [Clostridia bacterium]